MRFSPEYFCMADEIAQTGTYHTHIFMYSKSPIRFTTLKNRIPVAHIEKSYGSATENRDYITKTGKWGNDDKAETSTDISVFQGTNLVYTKLIPVGGYHITNDISVGLKIPLSEAEMIKRQYGYAAVTMLKSVENITINNGGIGQARTITNKELVDIIEARVQEICCLIKRELELSGYMGSISGGVVVTGGGLSFIKGSLEMASSVLGLPVRVGMPTYIGVASPIYSTGTGIVKYILSSRKSDIINKYSGNDESKDNFVKLKKQTYEKSSKVNAKIKDFLADFF
jgi:cell division protein FtsA